MTIDLYTHYQNIHNDGLQLLKKQDYFIDKNIKDPDDSRRGITLLARPDRTTSKNIFNVFQQLKEIEPWQYYYPPEDFHITIMSIISCYAGFQINQFNPKDYSALIQKKVSKIDCFNIQFKGISLNPSGIFINGYPRDSTLNNFRDGLRQGFKQTDIEQSLDKRYAIKTAHCSVFRFQQRLKNPDKFIQFIKEHNNTDFGTFKVRNIELVFNDWYQKEKNTLLLDNFSL